MKNSRSRSKNREIKVPRKTVFRTNAKLKCTKNPFFDCVAKIHKNPVLLTLRNNLSKKKKSKT